MGVREENDRLKNAELQEEKRTFEEEKSRLTEERRTFEDERRAFDDDRRTREDERRALEEEIRRLEDENSRLHSTNVELITMNDRLRSERFFAIKAYKESQNREDAAERLISELRVKISDLEQDRKREDGSEPKE